jgi:hypothetical protein
MSSTSGLVILVCCPFCFVDCIETLLGSDASEGKGSVLGGYQLQQVRSINLG